MSVVDECHGDESIVSMSDYDLCTQCLDTIFDVKEMLDI